MSFAQKYGEVIIFISTFVLLFQILYQMKTRFLLLSLCLFLAYTLSAQLQVSLQYTPNGCNTSWTITSSIGGGTAPFVYQWNTSATTPTITTTLTGNYCLTVTDANGLTGNACINVNNFNVALANPVYCLGDPITFIFDGGAFPININWQGQTATATTSFFSMPGGGPIGFSVVDFTDANGCTYSVPVEQWGCGMGISGSNLCGNGNTDLCMGMIDPPGTTYSWAFNGTALPNTTNCITITQPGVYDAVSFYPNGMSFNSSYTVQAFPNPMISVTDMYGCVSPITLDTLQVSMTNGTLSYVYWNGGIGTGFGTSNNSYSVTAPSSITIQALSTDGCWAYDTVVVDWCLPVGYVEGQVYTDINGNNMWDASDLAIPYKPVVLQPGNVVLTQGNGIFHTAIDTMLNVNITTPNYQGQGSVPASQLGYVANAWTSDIGNDFLFPAQQDMKVTLVATTNVSPGFGANFAIHYENLGLAANATVEMTYDPNFNNINSVSVPITSQTANVLTWNVGNVAPGGSGVIYIDFDMPPSIALGTPSLTKVKVLPMIGDANTSNNQDSLAKIVTGAFDPNDKSVSFEILSSAEAASGKFLDYTIRFQNTGTAPAQDVVVMDTLSSNLAIESFEMLVASHDFSLELLNGHILKWTFANIMLPDSNANEPASHGYIRYRIRPAQALTLGTLIENSASIYFDFNAPIKTNTATTLIADILSVENEKQGTLILAPNPASDKLMISFKHATEMPTSISIENIAGQKVAEYSWNGMENQTTIPINTLQSGIYILTVHTNAGDIHLKWIKE